MGGGILLPPHVPSWRVEEKTLHSEERSQYCEKGVLPSSSLSFCLSVCPFGRIFMKFDICVFLNQLWIKLKSH
jgi:hypothetical protein